MISFFTAEIFYENFYTAQNDQKIALPTHQRANHHKNGVDLPPIPSNSSKTNGNFVITSGKLPVVVALTFFMDIK